MRPRGINAAVAEATRGLPGKVPSDADLVYEVELLKIDRVRIEDTHPGNGPEVTAFSAVTVDLRGIDPASGTIFTETAGHGPPLRFAIGHR